MASDPRPESVRSRLLVLLVLGLTGVAGSVVVYRSLLLWERGLIQSQFRFDAQQRLGMIQRDFTVNLKVVGALSAFFGASERVEPDEFATFTSHLLAQHSGVEQLGWAPLVEDADGTEHFPLEYSQARHADALKPGFDLNSQPAMRETIRRVRESGKLDATGRLRLEGHPDAPYGFLVMAPVYRKGAPRNTAEQRRQGLEGIVLGAYRVATIVQNALEHTEPVGIDVYLFDRSATAGDDLLYVRHSGLGRGPPPAEELTAAEVQEGMHHGTLLDFPGHEWWIDCRPAETYAFLRPTSIPAFSLVASLLIVGLLLMYVNSLLGRNARVRRLVHQQTAQLRQAEENLGRGEAERRQADEVLRNSQVLYSSLVENLPVHVLRKDPQGKFTFANRSYCELLHRSLEEIVGKTDFDFYPVELAEKFRGDDRRVMESGQLLETVEENLQNGQRRYVQVMKFPVHDAAGAIVGVQAIFWDVTERRQAEAALEQERYLLHALMDNLPHNIYFKDLKSRFLRVNKAMAAYFGLDDAAQAAGKTDFDFFSEEHARQALADEQQIIASGQPILDKEEKETWPDGRCTWVASAKLPLFDKQGNVVGTFGISRDVTEQKRAAEALRAAKEAAESANRAKSDFLANMSHEIRTPLNAIIGMTELMLDMPLAPSQREYLTMVRESGESLLLVINDVLDFSRIEAGRLDLDIVPFDLREHLGDTLRSLAVRAHKQGLELACHVHPDVPDRLAGDPGRLRQVVVNLVGNAIKFTEQGEVVLNVAAESPSEDPALLHFSVTDTGIGIPEDKLGVIFGMFEQADTSTRRKHGGTGLGLAIASRLVECMGGRTWVQSQVGRGSTFHFTARFALAEPRPPEVEAAQADAIRGLPVLVVDDNATNRLILEEMLGNWEMAPASAGGADEALAMLQQARAAGRPYRLVVTDANMPETDGFMLARHIKQDTDLGSTVIMMLTSGGRAGDVVRCEELGIAAYLMKPIKQSELLDAVMMVLGVAGAEAEAAEGPAAALAAGLRPLSVLLAEDSLVNQKLAVGLLRRQGHAVTVAQNGHEAVAVWQSQPFDLVLMDVQMPEMDGLEAAAAIRTCEKQRGGHVPIIAMTAHVMKGDRQRCLEAGMDDYVSKPIRAARLFETIAATLHATAASGTGPPAAPPAPKCVDWSEALASVRGDHQLLRSIVEALREELPQLVAAVDRAVAVADTAALRIAAHTLKGSLRYFGATPVYDFAYALEQMARTSDLGGAAQTFEALRGEAARLAPELDDYLEKSDPLSRDRERGGG